MEEPSKSNGTILRDHERRIRLLERSINMAYGAIVLIGIIGVVNIVRWVTGG